MSLRGYRSIETESGASVPDQMLFNNFCTNIVSLLQKYGNDFTNQENSGIIEIDKEQLCDLWINERENLSTYEQNVFTDIQRIFALLSNEQAKPTAELEPMGGWERGSIDKVKRAARNSFHFFRRAISKLSFAAFSGNS